MPAPAPFRTGLRLAAYTAFALGLLVVSVVAWAWLIALCRGVDWQTTESLSLGLVCALVVWLFVAVFHLFRDTRLVAIRDRRAFPGHVREVLMDLGYEPTI